MDLLLFWNDVYLHVCLGHKGNSMAAVVGYINGSATQYVAHIRAQTASMEMVETLTDAMLSIFKAFRANNGGKMPEHLVIFRDGVSDQQFEHVNTKELPLIQEAIILSGYELKDVKICIVICQKRHNTRVVCEDMSSGSMKYVNPCPGLVVDATCGPNSIANATNVEYYLNSHASPKGTSKCCKYTVIYDQIKFKLSEIELLSYWSCYLCCRCTKSVSYPTPAYYAQ